MDWTRDAKYFYYLHGPLARTEIGHDKVQGLDYAYTLQGWIKGINSVNLSGTNDIGKDGQSGTGYNPGITDLHKYITDDAVGYALHYYGYNSGGNFINDYKAIAPAKNTSPLRFDGDASAHPYFTLSNSLFNGNIMAMATTIYTNQPNGPARNPQLATYKYDQLNRLNLMQTTTQLSANVWGAAIPANLNNYRNEFSYDPNGNILSQRRYDNAGVQMDNMTYRYLDNGSGRKLANRLYHVNDGSAVGVATGDIDDQGTFNATASTINAANNYGYDETGNLVRDNQEGIATVDWTVYGKIKSITRTGASTARNLIFVYDAASNRVSKASYTNGQAQSLWQTTYYVRDAQGNIMATYDYKPAGGSGPLTLNLVEQPIYGSSRLGQRNYYDASNLAANSPYKTNTSTYTLALPGGNVTYEVANHLGNVLTVVSDRKVAVPNGGNPNLVDRYIAEISSTTDYYPFGAPMPRRQFNNGMYRYGFNGKENDNEVKGVGNSQDYGARIYDNRLGKFLSLDPISKKYPYYSPYHFAGNMPLAAVDLDGEEEFVVVRWYNPDNTFNSTSVIKINNPDDRPFNRNGGVLYLKMTANSTNKANFNQMKASSSGNPPANNFKRTALSSGLATFSGGSYHLNEGAGNMENKFRNDFECDAGQKVNEVIASQPSKQVEVLVNPTPTYIGFKQSKFDYNGSLDIDNNNLSNDQELQRVKANLTNNPDYSANLTGNASTEGNPNANMILSENRINTVKGKLIDSGISSSRLSTNPQGDTNPTSTDESQNSKNKESINRNVKVNYNGPER